MIWFVLFVPLAAVLLLYAIVQWRTKQRYKRYNLEYDTEQHLSDKNKINNAAAWTNAVRHDHHSSGGGGGA
jgi:hypothetical protein